MKRNVLMGTIHWTILFAALLGTVDAATLTVTNTDDSGSGTLRAALLSAIDGDTIDFAVLTQLLSVSLAAGLFNPPPSVFQAGV